MVAIAITFMTALLIFNFWLYYQCHIYKAGILRQSSNSIENSNGTIAKSDRQDLLQRANRIEMFWLKSLDVHRYDTGQRMGFREDMRQEVMDIIKVIKTIDKGVKSPHATDSNVIYLNSKDNT